MFRGFPVRWGVLFGLVLASLVPTASPTLATSPARSTRIRLFTRAAQRSGVPLPVLVGLAWEQSMLSDHHGRPSIDDGYGLLDLSARRQHDTLGAAARLLRVKPRRLRDSDALNVLGGALLLARDERQLGYHHLPEAIGAWDRAVVSFTGMRSAFSARLIIKDMHGALEHGVRAPGIRLAPVRAIRTAQGWMRQMRSLSSGSTETAGPADYPGAIWEPANYNNYTDAKRPTDHPIRYIVIHDTESSCAAAASWFANSASQASAHYIVCLDGTVIQTVHERDIAWHAGNWPINEEAIGIEHEGYSDHAYYTRAQYLASAALVQYLCHKYHINPNRNVILGHENVPAADHTDPGQYWNWDFYMREVRGDATGYSGGITSIATITTNTDVYSCPEQSCSVLGSANWGEQFFISKEQPGWDAIFYGGRAAWVPTSAIAAGSGTILNITSPVKVLDGPQAGDTSVGTIPAGQRYISLTRDGGFWYIYYNHRYGFIAATATQATACPSHSAGPLPNACLLNSGSALAATPNDGMPSGTVTVAGTGMAAGPVTITLSGQTLATVQAGAGGSFNATLPVPAAIAAGSTTLTAVDTAGRRIETPFVVEAPPITSPEIAIGSQDVLPGGQVAVSGTGFPAETTVTITATFPSAVGQTQVVQLAPTGPDGNLASLNLALPGTAAGSGTIAVSAPGVSVSMPVVVQGGATPPSVEATIPAARTTPTPTRVVPRATPPATAPGSPAALVLSPSAAQPGTKVRIMGFGFAAHSAVTTAVAGLRVAGRTGPLGRFQSIFTVPATLLPGTYPVTTSGTGRTATARLQVAAHLATTYYFPGNITAALTPYLSLLNPGDTGGRVTVQYYLSHTVRAKTYSLPPHSEHTLAVGQEIGANQQVAMAVTASVPIAAERLTGTGASASADTGTSLLLPNWYLPLLTPPDGIRPSIAVLNPGNSAATVHLASTGTGAALPSMTVPAHQQALLTLGPSLLSRSLGITVRSSQPISTSWGMTTGGAEAVDGSQPLPRSWYFPATSTTGSTALLAANPTASPSHLTIVVYRGDGSVAATIHHTLAPYHRATFHPRSSAGAALAVQSSQPLEAGRTLFSLSHAAEMRDSGSGQMDDSWWFAGGDTRQGEEALLVFNPAATASPTVIRVLTASGAVRARVLIVPPHATRQLNLTKFVPNQQFGIVLSAAGPLVAEQFVRSSGQDGRSSYGIAIK